MRKQLDFLLGSHRRAALIRQILSLLIVVFLSQLVLQWFQNGLDGTLVFNFTFIWHTEKFLLSMLVLLVPALFLWGLTGNSKITNVLFLLGSFLVGFSTYEKMKQRGEPLYPADLTMIGEIDFLLEMLSPRTLFGFVILAAGAIIFLVWLFRRERKRESVKLDTRVRLVLLVLTSGALVYLSTFQEEGNMLKKAYDRTAYWIPYSQQMNYYNNGFVAGFLYNVPSSPMEEPNAFREEGMVQLIEKYQEKADAMNETRAREKIEANVIYIMNESFADPLVLKEYTGEWNPIPFTHSLGEQQWSGKMLSQGYGGGTANIEFEALTGFSMEPFAPTISTPFTQFLPKAEHFPSVVSRLKEEGHDAAAIHPYDTSMYKRRDNYANLGFDAFYYDETMSNTDRIENNPYISDHAAYQEVISRLEETKAFDFIHLVTMQNHTPYSGKYDAPPTYSETGFLDEKVNQYLQDLAHSDDALRTFYEELETLEEPTVVVFWGDHWPSVFGDKVLENNGEETLHLTPTLIFSNQAAASKEMAVTSPIYFFNEVLQMMDSKVSPFEAFLLELQAAVPAFEKGMYYSTKEEQFVNSRSELSTEAQKLLEEYDWIMYDTTTGDKITLENKFFSVYE